MNDKIFFLIVTVFAFSCSNESVDSSVAENNASDFFPNNTNTYWKYVVDSNSEDLPDMNFTALDSVYIAESSDNSISLAANNDASANGRMNMMVFVLEYTKVLIFYVL